MGQIRIVTDSTAEIPAATVARLGITVVPLEIHLDNQVFRDGIDITASEFFERLASSSSLPTTEPPSVETFQRVYQELGAAEEILSLHLSSKLSRTVQNAQEAAAALLGRSRITVVDSQLTSWGLGLLVVAAAEAALRGESTQEIVRLLRGMIPRIYIVFFVESLDYLERSARIGKAQAILGSMLGIKPLLILEDGEIMPLEKVRTREKAVSRLHEFIAEFTHFERLIISHGGKDGESHDLLERILQTFPNREVSIGTYSPSLAAYIGPGAMGVIVYEGL